MYTIRTGTSGVPDVAPAPGSLPAMFADMPTMSIPLYGASPTHHLAITGGIWSDPAVWSTGTVPDASSDVQIQEGADVTVTGMGAVARNIVVQGSLHVCCGPGLVGPCIDSRLTAVTISVLDGGMFSIGDVSDPVDDGVTAEMVFADASIDTGFDPEQWGHGLLVTGMGAMSGMVRMCGVSRLPTWVRLNAEAHAGDGTLTLGTSVLGAWRVGDTLDLPDSRQLDYDEYLSGWPLSPRWEQRTIAAISSDGLTLTLDSALTYDHLGGRKSDGSWDAQPLYPHVANTTRNVVVRSANPAGTRGHGLFTMRADVDVRHAEFRDLGRTLNAPLDSTTFAGGDPTASVTHVGTNQIGRYPIHWHHCWGPVAGQSNGLPVASPRLNQGTVYGCAVTNPSQRVVGGMTTADAIAKWGITQHDSSWLYNAANVVADFAGSLIAEEAGTETENIVESNYMTRCFGTGQRDDLGRDGDCYWARGASNRIRNNVATNYGPREYTYGYTVFMRSLGDIQIPLVRGADLSIAADGVNSSVIQGNSRGFLEWADNESYGGVSGMAYWWIGCEQEVPRGPGGTILRQTAWHYANYGLFGYETNQLTVDGLRTRSDRTGRITGYNSGNGFWTADYVQNDALVVNADVDGPIDAFGPPGRTLGTYTVRDSMFKSELGIRVYMNSPAAGGLSIYSALTVALENVKCMTLPGFTGAALRMIYVDPVSDGIGVNVMSPYVVTAINWQQVAGHDFRAYFAPHVVSGGPDAAGNSILISAQDPAFIPFVSVGTSVGSPIAGLTNQYLHDHYLPYMTAGGSTSTYVPTLKAGGADPSTAGLCVADSLLPATADNTTYTDVFGFTDSPRTVTSRSDNFNRADSSSSLGTPSDGGSAWVTLSGNAGISSNQAYPTTGSQTIAVLECSATDADLRVTAVTWNGGLSFGGGESGLILRATDANNCFMLVITPTALTLYRFLAGGATILDAVTGSFADGDTFRFVVTGNTFTAFHGATQLIPSGSPIIDSFNSMATKHGIRFYGSVSPRLDDFSATSL